MKRTYYLPIAMILALITYSCSDEFQEAVSTSPTPLNLTGQISQENVTRVNDYGFVTGDRMGIYVVDRINGESGTLGTSDNRATNVLYTFDGESYRWSSPTNIYWRDQQTPVDIYGYYPGQNYIADPTAWNFSVLTDQSTPAENGSLSGYEQSDLLWGKEGRVEYTQDQIVIKYHHILAGVRVHLNKGTGISDIEWEKLEKIVLINNTVTKSSVNLSNGNVTLPSKATNIIRMLPQSDDAYRAVVIPQTVAAGKQLLSITLDGQTYEYTREIAMDYQSGKLHSFTMTVNKREASGDYEIRVTDDGIIPWVNDEASHQFSAMAYVTVHCPEPGELEESIHAAGYDPQTMENLKVTGNMNYEDFMFINHEMQKLRNLNLREVKVKGMPDALIDGEPFLDNVLPYGAFGGNTSIHSLILPNQITRLEQYSLIDMNLANSTLEIPEGVNYIGENALTTYNYDEFDHGVTLILPSTIDTICRQAFMGCPYKCEIRFNDNLKYVGSGAFASTRNFYGVFHVPSSMKTLENAHFGGLGHGKRAISGEIIIPQGVTVIPDGAFGRISFKNNISLEIPVGVKRIGSEAFAGLFLNAISFPEGLTQIGRYAFEDTEMPFQLNLPSSLVTIEAFAFRNCKIKGELKLPESCITVGEGCFANNYITSLSFSNELERIGSSAFWDNSELKRVVLPKFLERIGENAFRYCSALQTIICLSEEPPILGENVWDGVYYDKCILQVPEGSVDAYRRADGWKLFNNITVYKEISINIPEIKVLDKGGVREGIIRADGEWEVSEAPSWCHISPSNGNGKSFVTISIDSQQKGTGNRDGRIIFKLQGKDYYSFIDVHQFSYIYEEDETITLQKASAGAPRPIPIFLIGDGFDAEDIASGRYLEMMKEQMENFFSIEPYKSYRNYFTVSTAFALAPNSGIEDLYTNNRNRFHSTMECSGLRADEAEIYDYVQKHGTDVSSERINELTILLTVNENLSCAKTNTYPDGRNITYVSLTDNIYPYDMRGFVLHNACGLGFGKLAPENVSHFSFVQSCTCLNCNALNEYYEAKGRGWYENISLSKKRNDLPWKDLIFHEKYANYVDVYEGGYKHARGVYRSEDQNVMSTYIPYFNAISRMSIVKRIMQYAGESFTFEKFVERDKREYPE